MRVRNPEKKKLLKLLQNNHTGNKKGKYLRLWKVVHYICALYFAVEITLFVFFAQKIGELQKHAQQGTTPYMYMYIHLIE